MVICFIWKRFRIFGSRFFLYNKCRNDGVNEIRIGLFSLGCNLDIVVIRFLLSVEIV